MGVNSLPKTVTRQRNGCDLNPGRSAPESSTLTTRLPSQPYKEQHFLHVMRVNATKIQYSDRVSGVARGGEASPLWVDVQK